jgi:hypothetical protein
MVPSLATTMDCSAGQILFQANTWNRTWTERTSMVAQTKNPSHGVHILHSGQKCAPQKRDQKMDLISVPL